jgi:hypothetical protein
MFYVRGIVHCDANMGVVGRQRLSLEVSSREGIFINRKTATQRISCTRLSNSYPASDKFIKQTVRA